MRIAIFLSSILFVVGIACLLPGAGPADAAAGQQSLVHQHDGY